MLPPPFLSCHLSQLPVIGCEGAGSADGGAPDWLADCLEGGGVGGASADYRRWEVEVEEDEEEEELSAVCKSTMSRRCCRQQVFREEEEAEGG